MASTPDAAANRIAARQRGLITWRQATVTAGMTEKQIEGRVQSKRWRKLQRAVYGISGVQASYLQSLLAAQLAARSEIIILKGAKARVEERDDAVVTDRSALWLRGCTRLGAPNEHDLLVSRPRVPVVKGASVRRTRLLPPGDIEVVEGIPTLAVPRLMIELCGRICDIDFVAVLDDLLGPSQPELRRDIHARPVELRRGPKAVDRLTELTAPGAEAAFRSWLERHTGGLISAAGLPPPAWNVELRDKAMKVIGIGDAVWIEERVVVELDGLRFHSTPEQRRRDNRKDRRLVSEGWLVLRYTWLDAMERSDEIISEIRGVLASRMTRNSVS